MKIVNPPVHMVPLVWYFMIMAYSKAYRRSVKKRPVIEWKDKSAGKPAPFAKKLPHFYQQTTVPDEYVPYLVVGALWRAKCNGTLSKNVDTQFPIMEYFYAYSAEVAPVPMNSLLVYAGPVHTSEQTSTGKVVQVIRHTFVAGSGRIIVNDLGYYVAPVD